MRAFLCALLGVVLAPVIGGLLCGLDRRISARIQSRVGPPLIQPFYDLAKLWGKERASTELWQPFCAAAGLAASASAAALFFSGGDLLMIFFVQAAGSVFLVIGALASASPYSQVGGQRELLQMLGYEPLLILVVVGLGLAAGGFGVGAVLGLGEPLLPRLPLLFAVLVLVLGVKLRKSPFDIAASAHAHQEIVRGVHTEYSGPYLAMVELAHLYDIVLILGLCALFWACAWWAMALLAAAAYLAQIVVDNASARLSWRWLLGVAWLGGLPLAVVNLAWLYAR
ncbi:MAG: NADH-quinone oxidoreductase subunit H [Desulfovibrionaceae bacterium]|nr:NADH-quinone oxidoreductase subunit H [Desulfovibrionaceae bacterium]